MAQAELQTLDGIRRTVQTLTGNRLDQARATELINTTLRTLWHDHSWSRAKVDTTLQLRPPKQNGTVSLSLDRHHVIGTGTSFTAADVGSYLRVSSQVSFLKVIGRVGQTLTLEVPYPQASFSQQPYILFRHIYQLPDDFRRLTSPSYWDFIEEVTPERIDRIDPLRLRTDQLPSAYILRGLDSALRPIIEIWPVPSTAALLRYTYLRALPPYSPLDSTQVVPLRGDLVAYMTAGQGLMSLAADPRNAAQASLLAQLGERWLGMGRGILEEALRADRRSFGVPDAVPSYLSRFEDILGYYVLGAPSFDALAAFDPDARRIVISWLEIDMELEAVAQGLTLANLPAAGTVGRLRTILDTPIRVLALDLGTRWQFQTEGALNAWEFGFLPSATAAQNTAAWTAMMSVIPETGGLVVIPAGTYQHTGLTVAKSDLRIVGSSVHGATGATRLLCTNLAVDSLHLPNVARVSLEHLWVGHISASQVNTYAIHAEGFINLVLQDVSTWVFPSQQGSWGGVLLEASSTIDTFLSHLRDCELAHHAGHALHVRGIDGTHRVGEVHVDGGYIAGCGGTGIVAEDFVYGLYLGNWLVIIRCNRGIDLVGTILGSIADVFVGPGVVLDDNDEEHIRSAFADAVRVLSSWIAAGGATSGSANAWGIRNLTENTSRWEIKDNYIAANRGGGIQHAGRETQISDNKIWDNNNGVLGIVLTATSADTFVNGNKFKDQSSPITDAGSANNLGVNMYDDEVRPRANSGLSVGDSNFFASVQSNNPVISFDSTDFWQFTRAANTLSAFIGGAPRLSIQPSGLHSHRHYGNLGATAWTSARFTLGAGWGSTAAVSAISATDSRGQFTITANGSGLASVPTVDVTFVDGAWAAAPLVHVFPMNSSQGVATPLITAITTGGFSFAASISGGGAPLAGSTWVFGFMVIG